MFIEYMIISVRFTPNDVYTYNIVRQKTIPVCYLPLVIIWKTRKMEHCDVKVIFSISCIIFMLSNMSALI